MTSEKLPHLIKLLDDNDPIVQAAVRAELWKTGGDVSHEIEELGLQLSISEESNLSKIIAPARQARLKEEWQIPDSSLATADGDWDVFESMLQQISDFLHDGVHTRSLLSDLLDEKAEEIEAKHPLPTLDNVIDELFGNQTLVGNRTDYYNPFNSDLVWVLNNGKGNPIALAVILMLVGKRLGFSVYGCNLPGHFLAHTVIDGEEVLVDAFSNGRKIAIEELLSNPQKLSEIARSSIQNPCSLGKILQRILANLKISFEKLGHQSNADLMEQLTSSLNEHV